jgi:putative oxidoreductase
VGLALPSRSALARTEQHEEELEDVEHVRETRGAVCSLLCTRDMTGASLRVRSDATRSPTQTQEVAVNTALLILRLVPGLLFIGHGLQKLVPPRYAPRALQAIGPRAAGDGFDGIGIRPGLPAAVLAGTAEVLGGASLALGLLTPLGTILVVGVMTTAILTVHLRNGVWNSEGGFEFPLVMLTCAYAISALGPGDHALSSALDVDNWAGIDSSLSDPGRAGIAVAVGVVGGLIPVVATMLRSSTTRRRTPVEGRPRAT